MAVIQTLHHNLMSKSRKILLIACLSISIIGVSYLVYQQITKDTVKVIVENEQTGEVATKEVERYSYPATMNDFINEYTDLTCADLISGGEELELPKHKAKYPDLYIGDGWSLVEDYGGVKEAGEVRLTEEEYEDIERRFKDVPPKADVESTLETTVGLLVSKAFSCVFANPAESE